MIPVVDRDFPNYNRCYVDREAVATPSPVTLKLFTFVSVDT